MIGRSNAVGGGSNKYKFTYNYSSSSGRETLNGNPISFGDSVYLEAGSINILYAQREAARLITEDGQIIPFASSSQNPSTRAPAPNEYNTFIMPSQNCSYVYN